MRQFICMAVICLFTAFSLQSQELGDMKFGKGLLNFTAKDSSFSLKFAPRIQFRSETTWNYNGDAFEDADQAFFIRRARLKFDGWALTPKLKYKIELGLSNFDIGGASVYTNNAPRYILDAVLKWNFYENFELWAGQTKLPGNVERVVSSGDLQFVDRSLLNSRFNIDRDIGIQLHHKINIGEDFVIKEKLALSQGEGRNVVVGNIGGLQYTGRLELLPFGEFSKKGDYFQSDLEREQSPKLMMGVVYDFNHDAVKTRSNLGTYMELDNGELYRTDIETWFVDAVFKYRGFSFMGEYANRISGDPLARVPGESNVEYIVLEGEAFNMQAAYLFKNNYEIAARYTTNDYEDFTNVSDVEQYTIGASKYIVGHKLKLQTDLSYTTLNKNTDNLEWRIGFDFHF
ncbi:OprO/OprP family phosphate-selective porin [Gramella sp. GC03-9]|uniref:OprO/OprP family phosphate-selective porin n=1 Tax=Christiangramia oceanisediminis TaxID=2920386 RepID=A0A9X2I8H7_9FLAO|nr:porin [Gramella oceanisediminis]MCP9199401.1 OprO/OprP family phosphate-selective porin [Gramella oceanisediminis]